MTGAIHDSVTQLRTRLDEQFQQYTDQLTELTAQNRLPDRGGHDPDTLRGLLSATRDALADTAEALRRMSDGSYGRCERCAEAIPIGRLEILPHARYCVACQQG